MEATGRSGPLRVWICLCLALLLSSAMLSAQAAKVALLIGNDAYSGNPDDPGQQWMRLANAAKDARDIGARLRALGFDEVIVRENLSRLQMVQEISRFQRLAEQADQAVLYFAGHGTQDEGINYLLPIDAPPRDPENAGVRSSGLRLDTDVLLPLAKGNGLKVVVVDACRTPARGRGTAGGLASPEREQPLPPQTLVVFAAAAGQQAIDGGTRQANGLFAQGMLMGLAQSDVSLIGVMSTAEEVVLRLSARMQHPVIYGSPLAQRRFSFGTRPTAAPVAPQEQALSDMRIAELQQRVLELEAGTGAHSLASADSTGTPSFGSPPSIRPGVHTTPDETVREMAHWSEIVKSGAAEDFLTYQIRYPRGQFLAAAQERVGVAYRTTSGCHIREPVLPPDGLEINWEGSCVGGLAHGIGIETYTRSGVIFVTWNAQYRRGIPVGQWSGRYPSTGGSDRKETIISFTDAGSMNTHQSVELRNGVRYEGETDATSPSRLGRPHGKGTMTFPDGARFEGDWVAGKRSGVGTAKFSSTSSGSGPTSYTGEFREDKPFGRGTISYTSGAQYVGEVQGIQPHGQGTMTYADGSIYSGGWANGRRSGYGELKYANSQKLGAPIVYIGDFQDDTFSGRGQISYIGGSKYIGEFANGQRSGQGECTYADGSIYIGSWLRDRPMGRGVMQFPPSSEPTKSRQYTGTFEGDGPGITGTGTMLFVNGAKLEGSFVAGQPRGLIKDTGPDGSVRMRNF